MHGFIKKISLALVVALWPNNLCATETLHPVKAPSTNFSTSGFFELDEDVYSADMFVSAEFAPFQRLSIYADGSFRFLSYSYEYSTKGYIHNYCNLHVNGFNETYIGARALIWHNIGLDINWRFPPGEGSQINRFHRLNIEPFVLYNISRDLAVGTAFRYDTFLEDKNYKSGDEFGIKGSLAWKFWWDHDKSSGWQISEVILYQVRAEESENRNLSKPYRNMKDKYRGLKMDFDLVRYFNIFSMPVGFGLNYEIHKGTLFGFETGHRIGLEMRIR